MPAKKHKGEAGLENANPFTEPQQIADGSVSDNDLKMLQGLAHRVSSTRKIKGYPVAKDFCEAAGITKQYLGNIELQRTKRPEAMPMVKIARALNVSLDWLLTGQGVPSGDLLKITPLEFDIIEATRHATVEEMNMVIFILKPYIQTPGKPVEKKPARASKPKAKVSPRIPA